nr:PREDICTED: protein PIGBOS1-like [Lepisosteus oculatus]XP_015198615.1 PREDICTED: protein PIGBOS1-like [Lepisosteus oculatus]XP_015198616.1 PREDICTED: protein PIGBOS1-like [Lepisosteus oculatus]
MVFRRLPFSQIAMATVVGFAGGLYVYKPIYEKYVKYQKSGKKEEDEQNLSGEQGEPRKKTKCACEK